MTVKILKGDCRDILRTLPDESVHCVVTSPPYFGLRDYGVAGQIGLEETPSEFVGEMVGLFAEVRRVLRADGTLWLNLGDSYCPENRGENAKPRAFEGYAPQLQGTHFHADIPTRKAVIQGIKADGIKRKDLMGIPWRVAFALQADGWYLRQDIIWSKPNPMPESVTDRCTKAHEYLFLLSKSERYFYDADAIAEAVADTSLAWWAQSKIDGQAGSDRVPGKTNGAMKAVGGMRRPQAVRAFEMAKQAGLTQEHIDAIRAVGITDTGKARITQDGTGKNDPHVQALADRAKSVLGGYYREFLIAEKRNRRSVWEVATMPFSEAHFATFPPALIEPCIKAGCPADGTVLDPFGGAGTTGLVADRLGRNAILIELNPEYAAMAERRIKGDAGMFASVS